MNEKPRFSPDQGETGPASDVTDGKKDKEKASRPKKEAPTSLSELLAKLATQREARQKASEQPRIQEAEKTTPKPGKQAETDEPAIVLERPVTGAVPEVELVHTEGLSGSERETPVDEDKERKKLASDSTEFVIGGEISLRSPSDDELPLRPRLGVTAERENAEEAEPKSEHEPLDLPGEVVHTSPAAEQDEWSELPRQQQQAHDYETSAAEQTPESNQNPTVSIPDGETLPIDSPEIPNLSLEDERLAPAAPLVELTDDASRAAEYVDPSEESWDPAAAYRLSRRREAEESEIHTATVESPVSRKELDDAADDAARIGRRSALAVGLLVGAVDYFGRKKLKRQFNTQLKTQNKQQRQTQAELHVTRTEQTQHAASVERQLGDARQETKSTETQLERVTRRLKGAEQRFEDFRQFATRAVKKPEQAPSEQPQTIKLAENERVEQSAWLTTIVDKDTGRPVENPAFEYGHEFYRERAHEGRPTALRNAAAGEVALVAAARATATNGTDTAGNGGTALPGAVIPSATMQGPPATHQTQNTSADTGRPTIGRKTGPIWPYLIALVVIFICLIVLLH